MFMPSICLKYHTLALKFGSRSPTYLPHSQSFLDSKMGQQINSQKNHALHEWTLISTICSNFAAVRTSPRKNIGQFIQLLLLYDFTMVKLLTSFKGNWTLKMFVVFFIGSWCNWLYFTYKQLIFHSQAYLILKKPSIQFYFRLHFN